MKTFTYSHPLEIEFTGDVHIKNEDGEIIAISKRIYDNKLKQKMDKMFDYRYFLKFAIYDPEGNELFLIKKISRRGKVWYEGIDTKNNKKHLITYENYRLGIPELSLTDGTFNIRIQKENDGWSQFLENDEIIAMWKAEVVNEHFEMILKMDCNSANQNVALFIGVCQAALFIGA